MNKIFHVFVSSTYSDLKDERKKVSEAIAKAGYVAEGMELFPASSQKQFDFIKKVIDRCDYYVLIIGGRYGTIADGNISYTEMEYQYALEKKISILAFLHKDPDRIESGKSDKAPDLVQMLRNFRDRVSNGAMVDFWVNADELSTKVVVALGQEVNLNPGVGWIRGNREVNPEALNEMVRLQEENVQLKSQLQSTRIASTSPADADLAKIIKLDYTVSPSIYAKSGGLSLDNKEVTKSFNISIAEIVQRIGYRFTEPGKLGDLSELLPQTDRPSDVLRGLNSSLNRNVKLSKQSIAKIKLALTATGLLTENGLEQFVWTDQGSRALFELNAE